MALTLRVGLQIGLSVLTSAAIASPLLEGAQHNTFASSEVNNRLANSITLEDGYVLIEETFDNEVLDGDTCEEVRINQATISVVLPPESNLGISYSDILSPLKTRYSARAIIKATGSATKYFGFGNPGDCFYYAFDTLSFTVDGLMEVDIRANLDPNPSLIGEEQLILRPDTTVELIVGDREVEARVEDTIFKNTIEDYIEKELTFLLSDAEIAKSAKKIAQDIEDRIAYNTGEDLFVDLTTLDEEVLQRLRSWNKASQDYTGSEDFLIYDSGQLLTSALEEEDENLAIDGILGNLAGCQLGGSFVKKMPSEPLYSTRRGGCSLTDEITPPLYQDAQCQEPVQVSKEGLNDYCETLMDTNALGDGTQLANQVRSWKLTPGTSLSVTLPSYTADTRKPYTGSVNYRETLSSKGRCTLEMRIYTPRPGATNLRPLIAYHGGSWSERSAGFIGMESSAAHFTSRDMVVFVPFYRMAGNKNGPVSCRGFVAEDLLADAEAALDWVKLNGADYGAIDGEISLFGQSAGAFLAASVALERSDDIDDVLLMYPPTDIGRFVDELDTGVYTNTSGEGILERFLGVPRSQWKVDIGRLNNLSLASRAKTAEAPPPMYMVHGQADDFVLPSQSEYLCDSLNTGRVSQTSFSTRLRSRTCGAQGILSVIEQAGHAMEVCTVAGMQCRAGDIVSAAAVDVELTKAYDWLAEQHPKIMADDSVEAENEVNTVLDTSSGGGALALGLLPLAWLRLRQRTLQSSKTCSNIH